MSPSTGKVCPAKDDAGRIGAKGDTSGVPGAFPFCSRIPVMMISARTKGTINHRWDKRSVVAVLRRRKTIPDDCGVAYLATGKGLVGAFVVQHAVSGAHQVS